MPIAATTSIIASRSRALYVARVMQFPSRANSWLAYTPPSSSARARPPRSPRAPSSRPAGTAGAPPRRRAGTGPGPRRRFSDRRSESPTRRGVSSSTRRSPTPYRWAGSGSGTRAKHAQQRARLVHARLVDGLAGRLEHAAVKRDARGNPARLWRTTTVCGSGPWKQIALALSSGLSSENSSAARSFVIIAGCPLAAFRPRASGSGSTRGRSQASPAARRDSRRTAPALPPRRRW